ncbi:MAG: hypothetical protein COA78_18015 [Blastopirellula sp.]|nr:MAG: hypothetical protein COA78_18015 [Blastopirellula sp.]
MTEIALIDNSLWSLIETRNPKMLWLILLTAFINLAFGFAVAVYVRRLLDQMPELLIVDNVQEFLPENTNRELSQSSVDDAPSEELDIIPMGDVVPQEMLEFLETEGLEAGSLVEASAQVLRLEVGIYRDNLVKIENKIRNLKSLETEVLEDLSAELEELNRNWLDKQSEAAEHLNGTEEDLGSYSDIAESLSNVLMDQAAQIESTLSNLEHLDFNTNIKDATRRLLLEVYRLLGLAHDLRDKMQETLLTVLRSERRLGELDKGLQVDSLTTCLNRTGLEVTFFEWWRDDIRRERSLSTAMLDIDAFKKCNERHGTILCDQFLSAFGKYLIELTRQDRGFDVVARGTGQQFIFFFGDTGPRNATSAVERIRQAIEATTFEYEGAEIEVQVSFGVTEVTKDDSTTKVFRRLNQCVRTSKKNGRNRTFIDEGNGPQAIDPPVYQVKGKVIPIRG